MRILLLPMVVLGFTSLSAVPAFAQSTPGSSTTPGATTATVGPGASNAQSQANPNNYQTTNANSVAQPLGQNTNVQVNNSSGGTYGFAPGVVCQGPQLAANAFQANSSLSGGFGNNNTYGGTVGLVLPLGNASYKNCNLLSGEILKQRQLDTQFTTIAKCSEFGKMGVQLHSTAFEAQYPELAKACAFMPDAPPQPVSQVIEKRVEVPVAVVKYVEPPHLVSNFNPPACRADTKRDVDLEAVNKLHHLKNPPESYYDAYERLTQAIGCNVTARQIARNHDD